MVMSTLYPLIKVKIRTPRRPRSLLRRERLVSFLHHNIHNRLILISAGAGYGKTSLLVDYAYDTDLPVCWYNIDANDQHVPVFLEYLVASFRQRFPDFGQSVLAALHDYSGPLEVVDPFVRLLVNAIEEEISQYFVIVLDNYHEVIDSEPVNALVDGLLRYMPEHGHVILASRGIPRRLTLTRLAARQEVVGLGVEHLRFTADEIQALLELLGHTDMSAQHVQLHAQRSEGWVTGILLAAQANWTATAQDILRISGTTAGVFDFLADEILARQPAEIQRFLLGSALFSEMTPPLCDALLEINDSAVILRELTAQTLFTFPLDADGIWYEYHQLFREFLVAKLKQDAPDTYRDLSLRQAEIMAYQGQWSRAIDGYLRAQAFEQAAETMRIVAQEMFDGGRWDELLDWIDALPPALLASYPLLLLYRGKIHVERSEHAPALTALDQAYDLFLGQGDDLSAARTLVQRAVVQRFRGQLSEAIATCRQVLSMAGEQDSLPAIQAHHNMGICYNMQGQFDEGVAELQRGLQMAESSADDRELAHLASDLGATELVRGRLAEARRYYHQALIYWRKLGNSSYLANTLQGLGMISQYLAQYAEAEGRYQEALSKARLISDTRLAAYALANQGDLYRDTGRYAEALAAYGQALDGAAQAHDIRLVIYLLATQGYTQRLDGDLERARQLLVEALDQVAAEGMEYEEGLCRLGFGAVALSHPTPAWYAAGRELARATACFEHAAAPRDLARALLLSALLAFHQGRGAEVAERLADVARLGREMGTFQFVVAEGPSMAPLLEYAQEHNIRGLDTVRLRADLEQIFPSAAEPARLRLLRPAVSLELLGLDGGQIIKEGNVVTDWESKSARLMAFLFASYPQGLRRERVIDMLWPEGDLSRGSSQFHSTMYRVRSSLFKDFVIHERGIYRLNPELSCRYDVAEFQRLARLGQGRNETAHIARVEAISLYRGPFLEGEDEEWADELRAALQNEMIALLALEGPYAATTGALGEAETLYMRLLALEPLDERGHRGIMWCRAQRNDRSGALRQFRECQRLLKEELGEPPSRETQALHAAIREHRPQLELS
jgi:ATP/maltotriose-dependent transcriptional regulator MalT/DNA-binding SARP family transcriptional activator